MTEIDDIKEKKIGWLFDLIKKGKTFIIVTWMVVSPVLCVVGTYTYMGWNLGKQVKTQDARITAIDKNYSASNLDISSIKTDVAVLKAQVADLHDWLRPTHGKGIVVAQKAEK